ncbi:MAG TPA: hypothetical protein VJ521_09550 [Acidobacteriota bacterium]|nr:hypothetical protein [Acidobacteriota bacterium]
MKAHEANANKVLVPFGNATDDRSSGVQLKRFPLSGVLFIENNTQIESLSDRDLATVVKSAPAGGKIVQTTFALPGGRMIFAQTRDLHRHFQANPFGLPFHHNFCASF